MQTLRFSKLSPIKCFVIAVSIFKCCGGDVFKRMQFKKNFPGDNIISAAIIIGIVYFFGSFPVEIAMEVELTEVELDAYLQIG